ncbi:CDP-alcohol phosphatidyltransferase family protein [Candidatus Parcubacteria bacterium]|nr:CDP-alcohol phosphatidyltransferase family protein [Candidatus Parcubacteria bacterium]
MINNWIIGLLELFFKFLLPPLVLTAIFYFGVLYPKRKKQAIKELPESNEIFTIPNAITGLGIVFVIFQIPCFLKGYYFLVLVLFFLSAISDVLDGLAASRLNRKTKLGRMMDPARDRLQLAIGLWMMVLLADVSKAWWLLPIIFFELSIFLSKQIGKLEVHAVGKLRQASHLFLFLLLFISKTEIINIWDSRTNIDSQVFFLMSISLGITFFIYLSKILKIKKGGDLKFLILEN